MSRLLRRPRPSGEEGFTLVEVVVTTAILMIVVAILGPLLTGSLTTFERQGDRSSALDQGDLVLQQIEHDVYASSVLAVGTSPVNALELVAVLPNTSDTTSCIEYRMTSGAAPSALALQRQVWTLGHDASTTGWQTLLTPLQLNGTGHTAGYVIPNPAGATPFTSAGINGQSVNINLQIQSGTSPVDALTTTATGVIANPSGAASAATTWLGDCAP
jgi:type II secretory pathway pseudopilin PulG